MLRHVVQGQDVNYTISEGEAGFTFSGSIQQLDPDDTTERNGTTFLPTGSGGGFSRLAANSQFANLIYHPNDDTFWSFDNDGLDLSCTSQLNVTVATSWGNPWVSS